MTAERDLGVLLRHMNPELRPGIFVFCTIPPDERVPPEINALLTFREKEGTTLVIDREEAEAAGLRYAFVSRMITLTVHSSLDAIGFLAAITACLTEAGISVNAVSAFHHDHLLVPADRAGDAMATLQKMSEANQD